MSRKTANKKTGQTVLTRENVDILYDKMLQFSALLPANGPQCDPECVIKHCNNGNAVTCSFSTIGTAFPRVSPSK